MEPNVTQSAGNSAGQSAAPADNPIPRRVKGEGGFQHSKDKKKVRGYKSIDGKRYWTTWQTSGPLVVALMKNLAAPEPEIKPEPVLPHTVGDAIAEHLRRADLAPSTLAGYLDSKRYLKPLLMIQCAELRREQVVKQYDALADRGLAKSSINQAAVVLKGGLNWAADRAWMTHNVASGVKLPPVPTKVITEMTDRDRLAMEAAMVGHRYEARYLLAIRFGARPAELLGLTWRHVDFEAGTITIAAQLLSLKLLVDGVRVGPVYATTTKTSAGFRTLRVGRKIMSLLEAWKLTQEAESDGRILTEDQLKRREGTAARLADVKERKVLKNPDRYSVPPDDLVFTQTNGDPLLARWDAALWTKLCKAADVDPQRLYSARHTAVSHMLREKQPLLAVSIMAGHEDPSFTKRRYGHGLDVLAGDVHEIFTD